MRMKATALRFALAAAGTALGALLLGGAASAQDTIKIGVTQPLTGAFAASGNYVAQGAKLAEEAINAAGGVIGKKMEPKAFTPLFKSLGIKKADFLSTNNDFGLGAAKEFSEAATAQGVQVGVRETMDPKATDFSAQLAKIKASGGDTVFVTTAVEQITLILKQAKEQQLKARIITTGGSNSPDQLIDQAGPAANGSFHLVFFTR